MTKRIGDDEIPITQVELDHGISSGVHVRGLGNELVPIQEEHEARLERGIGLDDWSRLPLIEKALIIAVRRNKIAMQNIQAEVEISKSERQLKQGSRKG